MKKNYCIAFLFFFTIGLNANELSWVDEQIDAIKPAREGVYNSVIANLDDPFVIYTKTTAKKKFSKKARYLRSTTGSTSVKQSGSGVGSLKLTAIINKSALINGKWYKQSQKIGRYSISKINATSVVLAKNGKTNILYMSDKKNNLKFKK